MRSPAEIDLFLRVLDITALFVVITCLACIVVWTAGVLVMMLINPAGTWNAVSALGVLYVIAAVALPWALAGLNRIFGG